MLPKKGRMLHPWNGLAKSAKDYAELIADALRREHDETHRTVKTVMRWTGASERSVKNWVSGVSGPSGYFLMRLCMKSPAVRELVRQFLADMDPSTAPVEAFSNGSATSFAHGPAGSGSGTQLGLFNGVIGDTNGDINGDIHVTINLPLNERQEWLLARVAQGDRCTFEDIVVHWQVSSRTAKRDIASLKDRGLIRYLGRHRRGFYVASRQT
jgi:hypothetical protein